MTTTPNTTPLPFGLGQPLTCPPLHCSAPNAPLPKASEILYEKISKLLGEIFGNYYTGSLTYLGGEEVMSWLEESGSVEGFIIACLLENDSINDLTAEKNLDKARTTFKGIIKKALGGVSGEEGWGGGLRDLGFCAGVSFAFGRIERGLRESRTGQNDGLEGSGNRERICLHDLITAKGLKVLEEISGKNASFPVSERVGDPLSLLVSIKLLRTEEGSTFGKNWPSSWKKDLRITFSKYFELMKEVIEEILGEKSFSREMGIFLESISQGIHLFGLIREDFLQEFSPGEKGTLCVGGVGGDNCIAILDFVGANRPSELLNRVKLRVLEKQSREEARMIFDKKRLRIEEILTVEKILKERSNELKETSLPLKEIINRVATLTKERLKLELEVIDSIELAKTMKQAKQQQQQEQQPAPSPPSPTEDPNQAKIGSSNDLVSLEPLEVTVNPFSSTAPRAESPANQSPIQKGKQKGSQRIITTKIPTMIIPGRIGSDGVTEKVVKKKVGNSNHSRQVSLAKLEEKLIAKKSECEACNYAQTNGSTPSLPTPGVRIELKDITPAHGRDYETNSSSTSPKSIPITRISSAATSTSSRTSQTTSTSSTTSTSTEIGTRNGERLNKIDLEAIRIAALNDLLGGMEAGEGKKKKKKKKN